MMAEGDTRFAGECARFEQRIFHSGNLLLHGEQRIANHRGTHTLSAQLTQLSQLQKVKKGIGIRDRYEAGLLPARQLSGTDAKNSQDVRSLVSFHWFGYVY